jgi:hypothetical protein
MNENTYATSAQAPCNTLNNCGFGAVMTFINANPDFLSDYAGCPSTLTCE